jgi:hypothetical protein
MNVKTVQTSSGPVKAVHAPNARQTFVPLPTPRNAAGQTNTYAANAPAIVARNARQTRV